MTFLVIGLILGAFFVVLSRNNEQGANKVQVYKADDLKKLIVIEFKKELEKRNLFSEFEVSRYIDNNIPQIEFVIDIMVSDTRRRHGEVITLEQLTQAFSTGYNVFWTTFALGFKANKPMDDAFMVVMEELTKEQEKENVA